MILKTRAIDQPEKLLAVDDKYRVEIIKNYEDMIAAYKLRHTVFCEELKWVPALPSKLELDLYDETAIQIGVFDNTNRLIAAIRIIMFENIFMLEKDFSMLVDPFYKIRKLPDTAETSRICVAPEFRNQALIRTNKGYPISLMLLKGVYLWCTKNKIRYIYSVVETSMLRFLQKKGFPCKLIGKVHIMKDGTPAVGILMDWRQFEVLNSHKRPDFLMWFIHSFKNEIQHSLEEFMAYSSC